MQEIYKKTKKTQKKQGSNVTLGALCRFLCGLDPAAGVLGSVLADARGRPDPDFSDLRGNRTFRCDFSSQIDLSKAFCQRRFLLSTGSASFDQFSANPVLCKS